MAQNPLQKYFRQPKIFIGLPSHGVYCDPNTIQGDVEHMPVFGMTGMDEILSKTPDALLTGESTVSIIQSCCPFIKNADNLSAIDIDVLLAAIRIATFGNKLTAAHTCPNCGTENEYVIDLSNTIEYYSTCTYDNKVVLPDIKVMIKPLSYKQSNDFSIKNFQIQQQLKQLASIEVEEEKNSLLKKLYNDLAMLQHEIFLAGIESVDIGTEVVTNKEFINEWLYNCDKETTDAIKEHMRKNQETWTNPKNDVKCSECGTESSFSIDLDLSNFFAKA